jgi:hypothetical protein
MPRFFSRRIQGDVMAASFASCSYGADGVFSCAGTGTGTGTGTGSSRSRPPPSSGPTIEGFEEQDHAPFISPQTEQQHIVDAATEAQKRGVVYMARADEVNQQSATSRARAAAQIVEQESEWSRIISQQRAFLSGSAQDYKDMRQQETSFLASEDTQNAAFVGGLATVRYNEVKR